MFAEGQGGNEREYQSLRELLLLDLLTVAGFTQQTENIPPQEPAAIPIPNMHWNREEHWPPLKHHSQSVRLCVREIFGWLTYYGRQVN